MISPTFASQLGDGRSTLLRRMGRSTLLRRMGRRPRGAAGAWHEDSK